MQKNGCGVWRYNDTRATQTHRGGADAVTPAGLKLSKELHWRSPEASKEQGQSQFVVFSLVTALIWKIWRELLAVIEIKVCFSVHKVIDVFIFTNSIVMY